MVAPRKAASSERTIECIEYADGRPSSPGYDPAQTTTAVSFRLGDLAVTASWSVPTKLRDDFRQDEERFFASLACP